MNGLQALALFAGFYLPTIATLIYVLTRKPTSF